MLEPGSYLLLLGDCPAEAANSDSRMAESLQKRMTATNCAPDSGRVAQSGAPILNGSRHNSLAFQPIKKHHGIAHNPVE